MGNFSISHYSKLTVSRTALKLLYIIDMAEVPTFQEKSRLDGNGDGTIDAGEKQQYLAKKVDELTQGLGLTLNGNPYSLEKEAGQVELLAGGLNLPTLRLTLRYRLQWDRKALRETNILEYTDANFPGRVGWKEIVAVNQDDIQLLESSVPAADLSRELTVYPEDPTIRPPQEVTASLKFKQSSLLPATGGVSPHGPAPGAVKDSASSLPSGGADADTQQGRPLPLVSGWKLNTQVILLSVVVVVGLGAWLVFVLKR
jgi:nickel/cobalt transporter (NicO) family protein